MLRKLKLYGELAKFIGHKEFEIKVSNLPQAISFLRNNFPEVESYMNPKYYQYMLFPCPCGINKYYLGQKPRKRGQNS